MKVHWTEIAAVMALVAAQAASPFTRDVQRGLRHAVGAAGSRITGHRTVKALQTRVAELDQSLADGNTRTESRQVAAAERTGEGEQMKPEMLVVITAAATTFLGKKVRIRSAQLLFRNAGHASAWAQQGRVYVQTSHNLRPGDKLERELTGKEAAN